MYKSTHFSLIEEHSSDSDNKMTVAHRGVGVDDPDLQATFDDPVHLTIPPGSWEEMERLENERQAKLSSNSDGSLQKAAGIDIFSTPKRKNNKQHKRAQKEGSSSSDSSSSTSVENMERTTDMEQKMIQLYEIVGNMATCLTTCVENQVATESAVRALAGLCQDNTTRTAAAIKSLQAQTDSIQTHLADVKDKTDSNTRHTAVATRNINSLQADQSAINNQLESIKGQIKDVRASGGGKGAGASPSADTCETGIFVSGIQELKRAYNMDISDDPVTVAGKLMDEIGSYFAISRIYVADRAVNSANRHEARAVIIYLTSVYHKRQAAVALKKYLKGKRLRVTVSDVFPAQETQRAIALNRYAYERRQDKSMVRTRVVNKNGSAVLQSIRGRGESYKDFKVPEESLKPHYQRTNDNSRERNANRRSGANGKDRHEREYRDQQRANFKARHSSGDLSQTSGNNNQQQEQTSGYKQLPQRTCSQQGNIAPPRQMSSHNSQPGPQQQPPHNQQQGPTPAFLPQQPQQHDMQPTYYNNSTLNSQWSQGASCPPVQPVNPMPHGFTQVPQNLLPIIQQQIYRHQQFQQQQIQQQQYYTTENNNQQLLMRHDANSTNSN